MLENFVKVDHLDPGVRDLVVNLARIPESRLYTNCEGHVWDWCPVWPSKNGWLYVEFPKGMYNDLV